MPSTTEHEQDSDDDLERGLVFQPRFDADGLLPAVVTNAVSGEALMFAWMNRDALQRTLVTGHAHFWSRSRQSLWRKGEASGNVLHVVEVRIDCDQDAIWIRANPGGAGVACHTGARSCFYRVVSTADGSVTLAFVPDDASPPTVG